MTPQERAAMEMAIDTIVYMAGRFLEHKDGMRVAETLFALRAALEAPEPEPVHPEAWQIKYKSHDGFNNTVLHGHNAIGDYRMIDPAAVSRPLFYKDEHHEKS